MVHRQDVQGFAGSLGELAVEVGNLRYDALAAFLRALSAKLVDDGAADLGRARPRLAANLRDAGNDLADAAGAIDRAWQISAPRMDLGGEGS